MPDTHALNVVIAGGGVAAVEAALALRELAGDRVAITLVAPQDDFELRALRTAEPFAADHVRRRSLRELADRVGARLVAGTVIAVEPQRHGVRLASGEGLTYDALLVAVGARRRPAFARALTFTGDEPVSPLNGLLADLEQHWTRSVAFVVPPGCTWPLPLYELALQTAAHVHAMGIDDVRLRVVSPESAPLGVFGEAASDAVAELLGSAGVDFAGDTFVSVDDRGHLLDGPLGLPLEEERIVALPLLEGPSIVGLPAGPRGFIPIDGRGRVVSAEDVWAAGDGTTFPVKQGGLACQMADAVAEQLAARAGADVEPQPFHPVLRGRLLTGRGMELLSRTLPPAGDGSASRPTLWSAPRKVDGRFLSAWLEEVEGPEAVAPGGEGEAHVDVEVPVSDTWAAEQPAAERS
ncbi:MAG TPA: FAD-dependent oxidoreductase [Baekduia sp.]|nr:FAD-dependent oxidoreductase [Baekduia sp.]